MAFITVAGIPFPAPAYNSGNQTQSTLVNEGRNIDGVFIGRRIGRNQAKVEMVWPILDANTWARLLQIFDENFTNKVTYFDMCSGKKISRIMYVNDRTATPWRIDSEGNVKEWIDCTLNLIDTGEGD